MQKAIKSWFLIKKIENGIIELKNGKLCKVLEVYPVNFSLKSKSEQESILYQYKNFLSVCDFDIQILVQSKKGNLDNHISVIEENIKKEKSLETKKLMQEYINMIKKESLKNAISKKFFIIFFVVQDKKGYKEHCILELNEKALKIKETLDKCGNYVKDFDEDNKELINMIYTYLNPITSDIQRLREVDYEYKK
jgi:hypothetical protein